MLRPLKRTEKTEEKKMRQIMCSIQKTSKILMKQENIKCRSESQN